MTRPFLRVSATGIALGAACVAQADNIHIDQLGSDNVAEVTQDGTENYVGTETEAYPRFLQDGRANELEVDQNGTFNLVIGTQDGSENKALDINQISDTYSENPELGYVNGISIVQTGGGNVVGKVTQRHSGPAASANALDVNQTGITNALGPINQTGNGNTLAYEAMGNRNGQTGGADLTPTFRSTIYTVSTQAFSQTGERQTALIGILGNDNDVGVSQSGSDNRLQFQVRGDENRLGLQQDGISNTMFGLNFAGSDNVFALVQQNNDNQITLDIRSADGNVAELIQQDEQGSGGIIALTLFDAEGNDIRIGQRANGVAQVGVDGDDNAVRIAQLDREGLIVSIDGDGNHLRTAQGGGRDPVANSITVFVDGDANNSGSFSGAAAALAAKDFGLLSSNGLEPGELAQFGPGNVIDIEVTSLETRSTGNSFAVSQFGSSNEAALLVEGQSNQAVVMQVGDNLTASLTQTGTGNMIATNQ